MRALKKLLTKFRVWSVTFFTLIMNSAPFGLRVRGICAPGYNCPGCPASSFGCPAGLIAVQSNIAKFPLNAIATMVFSGVMVGRFVCGYICPIGLLQDLLHKIPSKKVDLPRPFRLLKYAVLLFLVILFPYLMGRAAAKNMAYIQFGEMQITTKADQSNFTVDIQNPSNGTVQAPKIYATIKNAQGKKLDRISLDTSNFSIEPKENKKFSFSYKSPRDETLKIELYSPNTAPKFFLNTPYLYYCRSCPVGTLTATTTHFTTFKNLWERSAVRVILLLIMLISTVFISRIFCKIGCPIGAVYALTNKLAIFKPQCDRDRCVKCGACSRVCPMNLNVPHEVGGPECITCGDCIKVCKPKALYRTNIFKKAK